MRCNQRRPLCADGPAAEAGTSKHPGVTVGMPCGWDVSPAGCAGRGGSTTSTESAVLPGAGPRADAGSGGCIMAVRVQRRCGSQASCPARAPRVWRGGGGQLGAFRKGLPALLLCAPGKGNTNSMIFLPRQVLPGSFSLLEFEAFCRVHLKDSVGCVCIFVIRHSNAF